MQAAKDLLYGFTRHWWKSIVNAFTCFSVLFTVVKVIVQFFPQFKIEGSFPLLIAVLISIGWAAKKAIFPYPSHPFLTFCGMTHVDTCEVTIIQTRKLGLGKP